MKILQIAPIEEKVPPQKYGGTELVIYNIVEELAKKGHEVHLVGAGNSETSAKLIPFIPTSLREMYPIEKYTPAEIADIRNYYKFYYVSELITIINDLKPDIVHDHMNWRFVHFSHLVNAPIVSTLHGPIAKLYEQMTYESHRNANYVSISYNQRKPVPDINWVRNIYHGIDLDKFESGKKEDRDYFIFIGRMSPEKGISEICQMIRKTKHKLKIAAKIDAVDIEYYEKEVKPHIDGNQIEFVGEVDLEAKAKLLKNAKAQLLWLNWEEPFGLVVIESYAAGVPFIVNPRGSMKELVEDGKTGYLVNSIDEMQAKLDKVEEIDNDYCREVAEKKYSRAVMTDQYIELYQELIDDWKKK